MSEKLYEAIANSNKSEWNPNISAIVELIKASIDRVILQELDSIYSDESKVVLKEEVKDKNEFIEILKSYIVKYWLLWSRTDNQYVKKFIECRIHELSARISKLSIN